MAIATFFLTLVLAAATLLYAVSTDKLLRLSREQFEGEWRPDPRIANFQSTSDPQNLMRVNRLKSPLSTGTKKQGGSPNRRRYAYKKRKWFASTAFQVWHSQLRCYHCSRSKSSPKF